MDTCGICHKPVVQLFETGRKGIYSCFKCQPLSLVPEVTLQQDNSQDVALDNENTTEITVEHDDSSMQIGQDVSVDVSGTQEDYGGQEFYVCSICNKTFSKSSQLQNHLRNHRAERRFVCTYCDKAFSQSNNLRAHLRIHTNERPYVCTVCDKAFTQVTNLNNHLRLHTGERPFVCPEPGCNKAYAQVTNLNQHRKRHQNGRSVELYYECSICGDVFDQRNQMYNHRREAHSESIPARAARYDCKLCSRVFPTQARLMRHVAEHMGPTTNATTQPDTEQKSTYKCVFSSCSAQFGSAGEHTEHLLRAHQLRILSVPDEARPCARRGRPPKNTTEHKEHVRRESEYKCAFSTCNAEFSSASEYSQHLLRAHHLRIMNVDEDETEPGAGGRSGKKDPLDVQDEMTYEMQVNQLKETTQYLPKLKVDSLFQ